MRIEYAAIKKGNRIFTGRRHHEIIRDNRAFDVGHGGEQGFVTDTGRFVDRAKAADIAYAAGQILEKKVRLFSEDIFK